MDISKHLNENLGNSSATNCSQTGLLLNCILADTYVVFTKTLNFHWNVTGAAFGSYHALLGDVYAELYESIDTIAERIRTIDCVPVGSMKKFLELSSIEEYSGDAMPSGIKMLSILETDYRSLIGKVHEASAIIDANDSGTKNFLDELVTKLEKRAWMLKSHTK